MHLQDARCMNSLVTDMLAKGCIVLCGFAAKRKDKRTKGRSSVSRVSSIGDIRTSFPPAPS